LLLAGNYIGQDKSEYALAEDYAKNMIDNAGSGILFTAGDINSFPALYLRYAEGYADSLEIFDRSIRQTAMFDYAEQLGYQEALNYYAARDMIIQRSGLPCYLAKSHYTYEPDWLNANNQLYSKGILYKIGQPATKTPTELEFPIDFQPGDVLSRQLLVNLDLSRGEDYLSADPPDSALALRAFNLALKRLDAEPRATVLNNVGIFFRKQGYLDLAFKTYESALTRSILPSEVRANIIFNISNVFKDKGNLSAAAGDYIGAVENYEEALTYDPNNAALLRNVGLIYARVIGNSTEARKYLYRYLEITPTDSSIIKLMQSLP
jgi:tetratricopeptide (TPR) repeat protein